MMCRGTIDVIEIEPQGQSAVLKKCIPVWFVLYEEIKTITKRCWSTNGDEK